MSFKFLRVFGPMGSLPDVLASLGRIAPRLRAEVARAISRKHAPELSFIPAVRAGGSDG